jgi:hypothetical protein
MIEVKEVNLIVQSGEGSGKRVAMQFNGFKEKKDQVLSYK